ncbi:MAG: hypothetical protein GEU80_12440 [Dehalococcoidia bacterium]|nr:hypothetical protein [Dehalococcoidia bacterium]
MLYGLLCRLGRPAAEYPTLFGAVQSVSVASWHLSDETWLVESEEPASVVRDAVQQALAPEDLALVFPLDVVPAVWTSLKHERYGQRFLKSAMERSQQTLA